MIKKLAYIFLFFCIFFGKSQILRGTIYDSNGDVLPFATIYENGTTNGTISNIEGKYELKLLKYKTEVIAKFVGYQQSKKNIQINQVTLETDFKLKEQVFQLDDVTITNEENPANLIIRGAIEKRAFYEKEIKAYQAKAYMKSLQRLEKKPDKIFGIKIELDTGIVYLSESISEVSYQFPNKIYERIVSSKTSGNSKAYTYNQASDALLNFYQKNLKMVGLSERDFISPISSRAFFFYDYQLKGMTIEDGKTIYKIRLLPKRKIDPVFDGHIYIIDGSWKIHSVDYLLTKNRGIEFVDSLRINQVYSSLNYGISAPVSQNLSYIFGFFGIEGSGYTNLIFSDYEIEPNYELYKQKNINDSIFDEPKVILFTDKYFRKEVLKLEENSNKKDSLYWDKNRPIPLTNLEKEDYQKKDSIEKIKETVHYKDSVTNERNRVTFSKIFIYGYSFLFKNRKEELIFPSILSTLQYNTVEGVTTEYSLIYNRLKNENTIFSINPQIRYGFGNREFSWKLEGIKNFHDDKATRIGVGFGNYISQLNDTNPYFNDPVSINPFINTAYTLLDGDNYMKLFKKRFVYSIFSQEIFNGLNFTGKLEYSDRIFLRNRTKIYTLFDGRRGRLTSNLPSNNIEFNQNEFHNNSALVSSIGLRIRFAQKFISRPEGKILLPSKYPELDVLYRKGWKASFSQVDFDYLSLSISDDLTFGLVGKSYYKVKIGKFLSQNQVNFVDFEHFQTNQTIFTPTHDVPNFELLPYYKYSTKKMHFMVHYNHHFNSFFFNKVPLIRKTKIQAVISMNYLYHQNLGNYYELGVGIEHIFKIGRIDLWASFKEKNYQRIGIRTGFGF